MALGDDVQEKQLKLYMAYRRIKNFASGPGACAPALHLRVDPGTVALVGGFTRDVCEIGHWGTGDLELTLRDGDDLLKAQPLISQSYEGN